MDARPTQFSDLPPEVRIMIWRETIEPDEGVIWGWELDIFAYSTNHYRQRPEFYSVPLPHPIAPSINAESRAVAHQWMSEVGARFDPRLWSREPQDAEDGQEEDDEDGHEVIEGQVSEPSLPPLWTKPYVYELQLVRNLDLTRDYVYVQPHSHEDAIAIFDDDIDSDDGIDEKQPGNLMFAGRADLRQAAKVANRISLLGARNLALPAFSAYHDARSLFKAIETMPHLEKVYVIWDELPQEHMELHSTKLDVIDEWGGTDPELVNGEIPVKMIPHSHLPLEDTAESRVQDGNLSDLMFQIVGKLELAYDAYLFFSQPNWTQNSLESFLEENQGNSEEIQMPVLPARIRVDDLRFWSPTE